MGDKVTLSAETIRTNFAEADRAATAAPPSLPYRPGPSAYTAAGVALIESTLTDLRAQVHAHVAGNAAAREVRLTAIEATETGNTSDLST